MSQLRASDAKGFKKRGFWTTHYTMTLWEDETTLKAFATRGAHLEAMKKAVKSQWKSEPLPTMLTDCHLGMRHLNFWKKVKF